MTETVTAVTVGVKAGVLASLTAYLLADPHMILIMLVGALGGVLGYFKEVAHLEIKSTLPKLLTEFLVTVPLGVGLAIIVAEVGNNFYPMTYGWVAVSLIVALETKTVMKTIAPLATKIAEAFASKIGGKK